MRATRACDRPASASGRGRGARAWRRHAAAVATIVVAFAVAAATGVPGAYYGAALVAFTVWMAWFVLTTIDFLRRADF